MTCRKVDCRKTECVYNDFGYCWIIPNFERPYETSPHEECESMVLDDNVLLLEETYDEYMRLIR